MKSIEGKLDALLREVEPLLEPVHYESQKWFLINENTQELRKVRNEQEAMFYSYVGATARIAQLPAFSRCKTAFDRDNTFKGASRLAGYWGTFEAVLQRVIVKSGRIRRKNVRIDFQAAGKEMRELRDAFGGSPVTYHARARLLGVDLRCKTMSLPGRLSLHRLTRKEANDRQPFIEPHRPSAWEDQQIVGHRTEIRLSMTVPVDPTPTTGLFQAFNQAIKEARTAFTHVLEAILLVKEGHVALGPVDLLGTFRPGNVPRPLLSLVPMVGMVPVRGSDATQLSMAYRLVSGAYKGDKVLARALHRFMLGRQRRDRVDRLIDFVIAWEALLLTQQGNPGTQELSYRFSVNGSSLLATIHGAGKDRRQLFQKMQCAYRTRSAIVHGAEDSAIDRELKKGNFTNLSALCRFLEQNLRMTVLWLAEVGPKARPYRKANGWDELLWPSG